MSQQTTIRKLAELVNTPVDKLLEQLAEAGMRFDGPDQVVTSIEKVKLLGFLKRSHGKAAAADEEVATPKKITLSRSRKQELTVGGGKNRNTVDVVVRKKVTLVKPAEGQQAPAPAATEDDERSEILRKLEESRQRNLSEQQRLAEADTALRVELHLLYLNTSSVKAMMDIFDMLEESHSNGKQVAVSVDRQLFIVPFDLTALADVHDRPGLIAMKGCLSYLTSSVKNSIWSMDGQKLAIMFLLGRGNGQVAETIRVMDIHRCSASNPLVLDEFPAKHFIPEGYTANPVLPSFSWNGDQLFVFNTLKRNQGYGPLYTYDMSNQLENKINPIDGLCCYRDARFSPDGHFMLFSFQDLTLGADSKTLVYYIPLDKVGKNETFAPLKMLPTLFSDPRESPQFALHPAPHAP